MDFNIALALCSTDKDLEGFKEFLHQLSQKGGYAQLFYKEVINKISFEGIIASQNEVASWEKKQQEPVSKMVNGGIESKYYTISYRTNGGLTELDIASSSLITYMALADITRDEARISKLQDKFYECLSLCETQDDLNRFLVFSRLLSDIGGYAYNFHQEHRFEINFTGRDNATKYLEAKRKKNHLLKLLKVQILIKPMK